jgi:opacity protein-like surface antigen
MKNSNSSKYFLPIGVIFISYANIALANEKSNFNGLYVSLGASKTKITSSNNNRADVDLSGNIITEQDFKDNDEVYDYGLSYTHSLDTKFNISYILEFSPNKITNNYSGTQGAISKKDEIDNLKKLSIQLGYLATPELQIGFKAGLVKADAKYTLNNFTDLSGNTVSSSENHDLTGKSFGINAKKKLNENLFLNLDYSIVSFDKNDLNFNSRLLAGDAPNKSEHKIEFFTVGISYKFN